MIVNLQLLFDGHSQEIGVQDFIDHLPQQDILACDFKALGIISVYAY
jgi:hypothetical protein